MGEGMKPYIMALTVLIRTAMITAHMVSFTMVIMRN